jgi:hypothetical protein
MGAVMIVAKLYKPSKTAVQSGRCKTKGWVLEHPRASRVAPEPLMGWQASADTARQVKLYFHSSEAAIAYCKAHNIVFELVKPKQRRLRMKTYADNFAFDRVGSWTH